MRNISIHTLLAAMPRAHCPITEQSGCTQTTRLRRKFRTRPPYRFWGPILVALLCLVPSAQGQYRSPSIIEHPADVLVGRDEPATLNCHADGRPEPSITWYKDGRPLQSSTDRGRHLVLASGDLFFLQVRQDDTTDDAGTYWCVAANTVASARSNNATLEIAVLDTEFLAVPRDSRVAEGEVAMLECRPPAGSPAPVVTWLRDGGQLDPAVNHRYRVSPSGELVITSARVGDSGSYTCQARNAYATRSAPPATLTVLVKPHLVSSSGSVTASAGATVELVCRVGGDPPPEVFWGRVIPTGAQLPLERLVQEERGQVLRLRHVSPEDQGVYSCTAENPVGFVAANTSLTVHSRPVFTTKPKDARVGVDGTARFECSVSGSPEPSTYWTHEGSGLLASVGQAWAGGRVRVGGDNSLSIGGVREEDTGYYACVAVGEAGSAIARSYLEVQGVSDMPPPIIAVGATNQTLPLHTEAELPCEARGTPEPIVTWSKDGWLLDTASLERHSVTPLGTLRITELQQSDGGLYTCIASNIAGSSQWQAALAVHKATNPNIRFNKMFWHSDLPEPPQNLMILAINETQVTLGWSRGRSGSSSVQGHNVQYWSPDLRGPWRDGATVTPSHHVPTPRATTVTNLMPNTRYVFTVRSRNKDWISRPSVFTHVIRTPNNEGLNQGVGKEDSDLSLRHVRNRLSSPTVRLVSVEAVSATSLKVSWRVLVNDPNTLEGVYVRYRPLNPAKLQPEGALSVETLHFPMRGSASASLSKEAHSTEETPVRPPDHLDGAPSSHTIANLRPGTSYQVFVVPFYRAIEGQPTAAMRRTTLPATAMSSPTGLHYRVVNGTSVKVEWDPLPPTMDDGSRLRGYSLQVTHVSEMSQPLVFNTTANATFVMVSLLTGGATYELTVRGITVSGLGPPSEPLRLTPTWASVATETIANDNLIPATTVTNNTYIIVAIVCAAILVFGFLLATVVWIYVKRRNMAKCPHYFSKGGCSTGQWPNYSGNWEDGSNSNGISATRYNDGTVSAMHNVQYTEGQSKLAGLKNVHYSESGSTLPGMTALFYTDADGQFYAAADSKSGYEARPAEDMMYEDPEGLRQVSFKGRYNSSRCASPEPYATTPLIMAGAECVYPRSLRGDNAALGATRLPPNIPYKMPIDAEHNFDAHSGKGSLSGPRFQFPPPPPPPVGGDEGDSTTDSSNSRGSNPSRGGSAHHLLLQQHLPYASSGGNIPQTEEYNPSFPIRGSNFSHHTNGSSHSSQLPNSCSNFPHHPNDCSNSSHCPDDGIHFPDHSPGDSSFYQHPSECALSLYPCHNRNQVSPNNNTTSNQVNSSLINNPSINKHTPSHQNHLKSKHLQSFCTKRNLGQEQSGFGVDVSKNFPQAGQVERKGEENLLTSGVSIGNGIFGSSLVPGDVSDLDKEDETCWSTNDEHGESTSDGSVCSQQFLKPNWTEAVRLMGSGNWPIDDDHRAQEEADEPIGGHGGLSCPNQEEEEKEVKRNLLEVHQPEQVISFNGEK